MATPHHLRPTLSLSLWDGVALAMGSIAGSGILFLPSLTYAVAGHGVLLVWLGGTVLCLPMLYMFSTMVRLVPDGNGIEGFVERGLGRTMASTVPILFISLVSLGMPAATLVAGTYLSEAVGGGAWVRLGAALLLVFVAIGSNLAGAALSARLQRGVTWVLLAVVVALCLIAFPTASGHFHAVSPQITAPGPLLSGIVLAFWAYAGFENLTFIAGEFRNPRRDFPLAMVISFLVYGLLVVALTATVAAVVPRARVDPVAGLLQLSQHLRPVWLVSGTVVLLALALMQLNATSWVWGMSRLVYRSAGVGRCPRWFARLNRRGLPARAVMALRLLFTVVTVVAGLGPGLFVGAITIASAVFLFLYVLCVLSYMRLERSPVQRVLAGGFLVFLLAVLGSVGIKVLYPLGVCLAAWVVSVVRQRRGMGEAVAGCTEASARSLR